MAAHGIIALDEDLLNGTLIVNMKNPVSNVYGLRNRPAASACERAGREAISLA